MKTRTRCYLCFWRLRTGAGAVLCRALLLTTDAPYVRLPTREYTIGRARQHYGGEARGRQQHRCWRPLLPQRSQVVHICTHE